MSIKITHVWSAKESSFNQWLANNATLSSAKDVLRNGTDRTVLNVEETLSLRNPVLILKENWIAKWLMAVPMTIALKNLQKLLIMKF